MNQTLILVACLAFALSACNNQPTQTEQAATLPETPEAVYKLFTEKLKAKDFDGAQQCLHPQGFYFFTLPKMSPKDFSAQTLTDQKGQVLGAYAYAEDNPPKFQSGQEWLNYMLQSFGKYPAQVDDNFRAGSGYEGNMTSDHLLTENATDGYFKPGSKILSMHVNTSNPDDMPVEYLLVEFVQDNGHWKIYAIGNWEWTP